MYPIKENKNEFNNLNLREGSLASIDLTIFLSLIL